MITIHLLARLFRITRLAVWAFPHPAQALGLLLTLGFVSVVTSAVLLAPDTLKLTPLSISPDGATQVFDRDTTTAYTPGDGAQVIVTLETAAEIRAIKVYGASAWLLSVQAEQNGAWQAVSGVQNIPLGNLSSAWNTLTAATPVVAGRLRLDFAAAPNSGVTELRVKELEIWAAGTRSLVQDATGLLAAWDSNSAPSHARVYTSTPQQGVIGLLGNAGFDDTSDNQFNFTLAHNPADYKRAWLSYEVQGRAHWAAVNRAINGNPAQGGLLMAKTNTWASQIEPINPAWLAQGSNRINFNASEDIGAGYTVRNVRLLVELDDGAHFMQSPAITGKSAVYDGKLDTGWAPYSDATSNAELELNFDHPTQTEMVDVYLANSLKGTIQLDVLQNATWVETGTVYDATALVAGWNHLSLTSTTMADGLRIKFMHGNGSLGEVREIALFGSSVGVRVPPELHIGYPNAGQFIGRIAYIQGYLAPLDNGSGPARIYIGGQEVGHTDGAFGVSLTKDEIGLTKQADSDPWSVEVKAVYPDGKTLITTVALNQYLDPATADPDNINSYYSKVTPGKARKLAFGGAELDIGADALESEVTIGIKTLSDDDLPPLDPGMTNVTKGSRKGYRFTPHGTKFKNKIKVTLPFDSNALLTGQTEQDINTYYFDTEAGRWQPLERASVNADGSITSLTNHFTDMINATITVPDHPNPASFNPTSMKDIKAADPGAKINLIEPPQANNMGDARLSYPLEIPPGRLGMQPQLAVSYNSGGGNGWMGLGWDLSVPSISIETRWGVPRYDANLETETYILNGEQLTPVAHREELQARTAEKIFHTRIEGAFRKIIRHGDSPANYWWEVTDKNGMRHTYGSPANATGDATLTDDSGNIYKWGLRTTQDTNGNTVSYSYQRIADAGLNQGSIMGTQIYLQEINYTGYNGAAGAYSVTFERDRDLPDFVRRPDVSIDARGGFKMVTADLLKRVKVKFNGEVVRSYQFDYEEGAFKKTLLKSVSQFDGNGALFNSHSFGYYDEARNADGFYKGFSSATGWNVGADGVGISLFGKGAASAFGGSSGETKGGHFYIGFGTDENTSSKTSSVGNKFGYSQSKNETLIAMSDMNGDGLPDKVFKSGDAFYYRANRSGPNGSATFDAPVMLPSLPAISREKMTSFTTGIESFYAVAAMTDVNFGHSRSDTYFSDVNGDGLIDLVNGGRVLFGYVNTAGVPTFSANSADTPVAIGTSVVNADGLLKDPSAIEDQRATAFPLLDSVRRWVAPYDGVVSIEAPVSLIQDNSVARAQYEDADGVRVAIQLEGAELWASSVAATDYTVQVPTGVSAVPVQRGDRFYFRVQSVFDGSYDQVAWDPKITYVNADVAHTDVNDLPVNVYGALNDFTLFGRRADLIAPVTGTLHLAGQWSKSGVTTDDVTLLITRNGNEVYRHTLGFAEIASIDLSQDISVTQLDKLEWRILVDSPIDATRIKLSPAGYYTAAQGVDSVTDEQGNYVLQINPPYGMDIYPVDTLTAPQAAYTVPASGVLPVQATLQVSGLAAGEQTQAVFTVKRRGELLAKQILEFTGATGGQPVERTVAVEVTANQNDQLFFDVSSRDTDFPNRVTNISVSTGSLPNPISLPVALHTPATEGLYAQPYRGWSTFGYNGQGDRALLPIDQSVLQISSTMDQNNMRAYPYSARGADVLWGGIDAAAWVKAAEMSASRLGLDDIRMPRSAQFAGAVAVPRLSESRNISTSVAGVTVGLGDSESELDFQDLNGDRFPDVVGQGSVQYTRATGVLQPGVSYPSLGSARESSNKSGSFSIMGTGSAVASIASSRGTVIADGGKNVLTSKQGSDMPSLGLDGSLGEGSSNTEYDLIDINGDGLPDKVHDDGNVSLNLGYRFAAAEYWGGGKVNNGQSRNQGISLGFNMDFYSIAGGLSVDTGTSESGETYADINGDGLPDKVFPGSVRLNTGNGFTSDIAWPGGQSNVVQDKHISLGGGLYMTMGVAFYGMKVVFNPGFNYGISIGRPEIAFRDMDGDGFADQVQSDKDSELNVALNPIGRTNLLKEIKRPLGAVINLEYTRSGNTYDQPQSKWVMSQVSVADGHSGEGADTQLTTFKYEGGRYDRLERDFYGYGKVTEEQRDTAALTFGDAPIYRTLSREYLTDNYYDKGLLSRELTADATGHKYIESANTYLLHDVSTDSISDGNSTIATVFPQLSKAEHFFFEGSGSASKSTATLYQYDSLGNITRYTDNGDTGAADDVEATIAYSNCADTYVVGTPTSIQVNGNATLMRRREATVDCASGNTTQIRQYLADGQAAITDLGYTPQGNLKTVTGPTNQSGQRYVLNYGYEQVVTTHIASISDSFGLSSSATHDYHYGAPLTVTDTNGQTTSYTYDTVGRTTVIQGPNQQGSSLATLSFTYHPEAGVPYALTQHLDLDADGAVKPSATLDTLLFTDGLKRILQTKKDATVNGNEVMIVSGRLTFDAFGRSTQQTYPDIEAKGSNTGYNPSSTDPAAPTKTTYDILDRTLTTTLPDSTSTTIAYGFGSDRAGQTQFATTVTDANGKTKLSYRDVRQLITAVKETNLGLTIWTSYSYNPLKQITQVKDDKNNLTTIVYDNLGRRKSINNPDTGLTETVYDLASNVTQKITAALKLENKAINYDYDYTRLKGIRYPNFPGNNVSYTYGTPDDAGDAHGNRAGRLITITSEAGIEERRYDRLGNINQETRTLTRANTPEVYTTRYSYDTFGRLLRLTYADGEVLTYTYDAGGNLKTAQGKKGSYTYSYLTNLSYDPFEQRTDLTLGNGITTHYTYRADNRRLSKLASSGTLAGDFQKLAYTYDNIGNITALANSIAIPPSSSTFGGPASQTFGYDDLYRLTQASGDYTVTTNKQRHYTLNLSYDSIHNLTKKTQSDTLSVNNKTPTAEKATSYDWDYLYNANAQPHAPLHIGFRSYQYDANGNQTGFTHDKNNTRRILIWDEENRIQNIFENASETTYAYDDQGQRILKHGAQGDTAYINAWLTMSNGGGTKHIYAGSTRLVSKLIKQDQPGGNPSGNQTYEKDQYYYHPDHLGSTALVTDASGQLYQHMEYFPFGETWVQESGNVQKVPYLFSGKELDEDTQLYYFGARYYDPRTSVWQSADPILGKYLDGKTNNSVYQSEAMSLYAYVHQNPLKLVDPDGRDAIPVAFPDYKISALGTKWGNLGHAGIILIDAKSGATRYYEFGRYDAAHLGEVKRRAVPDVIIDKNTGKPTEASLTKLLDAVSKKAGNGTRVEGTYVKDDNFQKMVGSAESRMKQNTDDKREPYGLFGNNCASFCKNILESGGQDTPAMFDPRPNSYIGELQSRFGNQISYDPANKKLEIKNTD